MPEKGIMPALDALWPRRFGRLRGPEYDFRADLSSAVLRRNDRMSSATTRKSAPAGQPREAADAFGEVLLSPWLWGPVLTAGFYLLIPHLPQQGEFLAR